MNFIFDEFIRIEADNCDKIWVSAAEIAYVRSENIDHCTIGMRNGFSFTGVKMPATVLLNRINRIREENIKEFARN